MAQRNNYPFEILDRKNASAFLIFGHALSSGRFIIRDADHKWNIRLAAKAVMACVPANSTLWLEARVLSYSTNGTWSPRSIRAVLAQRRKTWNKQRR